MTTSKRNIPTRYAVMTKFNFNDVDYPLTKDEIQSQFESAFPSVNFDGIVSAEFEKAERRYIKLLNDFNNGNYYESNSICKYVREPIQSQPLEKDKIVELLAKYDNFEIVFNDGLNMWCVEIKSHVFNMESPATTAIKNVIGYINRKNELTKKYTFSQYTFSDSMELKFDISCGVRSNKSYNKFTYSEEFIMGKLGGKFNSLFPHLNFVQLLNAIYDYSVLIVEKYETEFNNGNYSWSNSKLIESYEYVPSRISADNLKGFVNKYDNFVIGGDNEEFGYNQGMTIKKYIKEIESPEYMTIARINGFISDFTRDNNELSKLDEFMSQYLK